MNLSSVSERLKEKFNLTIDKNTIKFPKEKIEEIFEFVKKELGFDYLSFITAIDYKEKFEIVYYVRNLEHNLELILKTELLNNASLPSVFRFYKGANWMEREIYDLFGIEFEGHPDLRRIMMPPDYKGHPLRKEFPINAPFEPYR